MTTRVQVDTLFLEDALLLEAPGLGGRRRVRGDGYPGGPVRPGDGSEHALHARG